MLNLLSSTIKAYNSTGSSLLRDLEEENLRSESFFKEIENWRNVELNYIAKVSQVASNLRDRSFKVPHREKEMSECPSDKPEETEVYFCANA
jgi:hypothetical protein